MIKPRNVRRNGPNRVFVRIHVNCDLFSFHSLATSDFYFGMVRNRPEFFGHRKFNWFHIICDLPYAHSIKVQNNSWVLGNVDSWSMLTVFSVFFYLNTSNRHLNSLKSEIFSTRKSHSIEKFDSTLCDVRVIDRFHFQYTVQVCTLLVV